MLLSFEPYNKEKEEEDEEHNNPYKAPRRMHIYVHSTLKVKYFDFPFVLLTALVL